MATIRSAFACCFFAMVCTAQNHSRITIHDGRIELEGRGTISLIFKDHFEALLTALYELCDYYNTCDGLIDIPEHDRKFLGCCVPCDCSDKCYVTGNCCRDKTGGMRAGNKLTGSKVSERGEVCANIHPLDSHDDTSSYLLVSQCHPEYKGNSRSRCENNTKESIDDVTPVFSSMTGLAYSNIHCASCNFQNTLLEQWDMFMVCANYTPVHHDEQFGFVRQGCKIIRRAINPFISSCYTKTSAADCERAQYKNICNRAREGYGYIKELRDNFCYRCLPELGNMCGTDFSLTSSYEVLINWEVYMAGSPGNHSSDARVCPEGERFNDLEQRCLRVTCAPSQFKIEDNELRCMDVYTMVRGVCLDYRLRITIPSEDGAPFNLLDWALTHIDDTVFPNYPKPNAAANIIDYRNVDGAVIYNIQRVDDLQYTYAEVSDRILELQTNLQNAPHLMHGIQVEQATIGNTFESLPLDEIGYLSYAGLQKENCNKMVAMSGMQICEMVMFAPGEYSTHRDVVVLGNGRLFQPHEYVFRHSTDGKRLVQICLETYLSRKGRRTRRSFGSGGNAVTMNDMSKLIIPVLAQSFLWSLIKM